MTDLRTAAQQALYMLEAWARDADYEDYWRDVNNSINALRAALAEPVQEPVAWRHKGAGHFTVNPLVSKFSEWEPLYTAPRKENNDA